MREGFSDLTTVLCQDLNYDFYWAVEERESMEKVVHQKVDVERSTNTHGKVQAVESSISRTNTVIDE
ncbi:12145_t:CDS:2 [Funneliformis mosseae]|uniref:12145_t:CDS:1 n=1 Tax=Funneliformis mosseae TaxID=27381 RepID=A0A9N9BC79_FUNMO|nr:12145_t:CDS:2 [Funneliformis mosseae]